MDALHVWLPGGVPHSFPSLYGLRRGQPQSGAYRRLGERDTQVGVDPSLLPLHAHMRASQAAELRVDFRRCQDIRTQSESQSDTSHF